MEPELLEVLSEAVRIRHRKEELERAVGRALRRREMDFQEYVRIMSELREAALAGKTSIEDAAKKILSENEQRD